MKNPIFALLLACLLPLTALAQQGTLKYKMTGVGPKPTKTTLYFADGNFRAESEIPLPDNPKKKMTQVVLFRKDKPNTMVVLNDKAQTYTETATKKMTNSLKTTVKVIGPEKIKKYNCTHSILTVTTGGKSFQTDYWTTRDIAGYEQLTAFWRNNVGMNDAYETLRESGADGMTVKMTTNRGGKAITMELDDYSKRKVAAKLFEIPSGYKKGASFDPSELQKMTPAQRKEFVEGMMKQQKSKP
jgi:Domain of unknown function (DUF4412)